MASDSQALPNPKGRVDSSNAINETYLDEFSLPISRVASANRFAAFEGAADSDLGRDFNSEAEGSEAAAEVEMGENELHHETISTLDGAADIHLAYDPDSEAAAQKEISEEKLHQEMVEQKRQEEADKVTKSDLVGSRALQTGESLRPDSCENDSPHRNLEKNPLKLNQGGRFKISRDGTKTFLNPPSAEFQSTTPGATTTAPGFDNPETSHENSVPVPHPYVFNSLDYETAPNLLHIAGKRRPETHATRRVMKKPKGIVKNATPTAPYRCPNYKDILKASATDISGDPFAEAGHVAGEEDKSELLTLDESGLCAEIDDVLNRMFGVNKQISAFRKYLAAENNSNKPLYQWDQYAAYPELHLATVELDKSAGHLKPVGDKVRQVLLPRENVVLYLDRALKLSTSTSKSVAFALKTMSAKSATCMDEIVNSSLDEEGRDAARTVITHEIGELLKHSTDATNSVYAAMDLLRSSLRSGTLDGMDKDAKSHEHIKRGFWQYGLLLGLSLFGIGLNSFGQFGHLLPADWVSASWIPSNRISGMYIPHGYAVVDIASLQKSLNDTINAVAELSTVDDKVTSTRMEHLEETHEVTGQRIDDIWEALGPPGPDGCYEFGPHTSKPNEDAARGIQEIREEVKAQLDRVNYEIAHLDKVHEEIVDLRRHVHRVDLRLSKRIDHLPGGKS